MKGNFKISAVSPGGINLSSYGIFLKLNITAKWHNPDNHYHNPEPFNNIREGHRLTYYQITAITHILESA